MELSSASDLEEELAAQSVTSTHLMDRDPDLDETWYGPGRLKLLSRP